jgi:hypothetical protein
VEFRPGRLNTVADALSHRQDGDALLSALSKPSFALFDDLRRELNDNIELRALQDSIVVECGMPWRVVDGLILRGGARVFILAASMLVPTVLELAHSTGHEGIQKTCIASVPSFATSCVRVWCVSGTTWNHFNPWVYYNRWMFPRRCGPTFHSTSSKAFPGPWQ